MAFASPIHQLRLSAFRTCPPTSTFCPSSRPRPQLSTHRLPPCNRSSSPPSFPTACASSLTDSDRKQQLLDTLSEIIDPDLHQNIVSLGFIKDIEFSPVPGLEGLFDVSFKVELTTPACPIKDVFQADCKRLAEGLAWIGKASVSMTAAAPGANITTSTGAFDYVNSIVAVASCKGGVGKSTTAVNLAFSLAAAGARVGIMDADIYGPSLPTLVEPDDSAVQFKDGRIQPLESQGVKLMSFGYVNPDSAIMRGPMIASVLNQLLTTTQWGVLDYLIVDMPPGTGDVQLTLSQIVNISAAVIVTTPQKLSFVDVVKGIDMFDKVNVPSIAVVENMAYFVAPDSGTRHEIFGRGHRARLVEQYGLHNAFSMPIDAELCERSDNGVPFVASQPESLVAEEYKMLAACVAREVAKLKHGGNTLPAVSFNEQTRYIEVRLAGAAVQASGGSETGEMGETGESGTSGEETFGETPVADDAVGEVVQQVWPAELRRACRCALCVDEMTGRMILDPASVEETVAPVSIRAVGNYAVEVIWSDGHPSLYPYASFVDGYTRQSVLRAADKSIASEGAQSASPVTV